jgi:hypothetical protein
MRMTRYDGRVSQSVVSCRHGKIVGANEQGPEKGSRALFPPTRRARQKRVSVPSLVS